MRPDSAADPERSAWDACIWVDDADPLIAEFKGEGSTVARDLCEQPNGNRDFDVADCNGYRRCFGRSTEQGRRD